MKDLLTNKLMIAFMIAVCVLSFAVGKNDAKIDEQKNAVAGTTTVKNLTK